MVVAGGVLGEAVESISRGDRHRSLRAEAGVVLAHDNARTEPIDGVPDPVVDAVDIDGEQVEVAALRGHLAEQVIDVLGRHETGPQLDAPGVGAKVVVEERPRLRDVRGVRVEQESGPAESEREVGRVALETRAAAELEEPARRRPDTAEQVEQDPVLTVLGPDRDLPVVDRLVGGDASYTARSRLAIRSSTERNRRNSNMRSRMRVARSGWCSFR